MLNRLSLASGTRPYACVSGSMSLIDSRGSRALCWTKFGTHVDNGRSHRFPPPAVSELSHSKPPLLRDFGVPSPFMNFSAKHMYSAYDVGT